MVDRISPQVKMLARNIDRQPLGYLILHSFEDRQSFHTSARSLVHKVEVGSQVAKDTSVCKLASVTSTQVKRSSRIG